MTRIHERLLTIGGDEDYKVDFVPSATVANFLESEALIQGIMGPWGSGKSSACDVKIFREICRQNKARDGYRYSRWMLIRNTYSDLRDTTLQDFISWFPPEHFGDFKDGMPMYYHMRFGDVRAEIQFVALDQVKDIRKLLSRPLTAGYINEAREIPYPIVKAVAGRTGRFPSPKDGGCRWHGLLMDTNPPDEDHWWPRMFGDAPPLDEVTADEDPYAKDYAFDPTRYRLFKQPSGLSPEAENLENLPGGRQYYIDLAMGAEKGWVETMVHGRYGAVRDGKLVYPEFSPDVHISKTPLAPNPNLPLLLGFDYGLTPACVIAQITPQFRLNVLEELQAKDLSVRMFIRTMVKWTLQTKYRGYKILAWGDPAGDYREQVRGDTVHRMLQQEGIPVEAAANTNDFVRRQEAVSFFLTRMWQGLPAFQLDPRCKIFRYGFLRGYRFKRVEVQGEKRFVDEVDKRGNPYTHLQDALQYLCLGFLSWALDENYWRKRRQGAGLNRRPQRRAHAMYGP